MVVDIALIAIAVALLLRVFWPQGFSKLPQDLQKQVQDLKPEELTKLVTPEQLAALAEAAFEELKKKRNIDGA